EGDAEGRAAGQRAAVEREVDDVPRPLDEEFLDPLDRGGAVEAPAVDAEGLGDGRGAVGRGAARTGREAEAASAGEDGRLARLEGGFGGRVHVLGMADEEVPFGPSRADRRAHGRTGEGRFEFDQR